MVRIVILLFSLVVSIIGNGAFDTFAKSFFKKEELQQTESIAEELTTVEQQTSVVSSTVIVENKLEEETTTAMIIEKSCNIDIQCILQMPELPTGCEITSLTMVLNYLGINADKCDMADNWLMKGTVGKVHPNDYFLGNPRDNNSYGCYAPVIINCANTYLEAIGRTDLTVRNLTGSQFEDLLKEIDKGNPVIIWATVDMKEPYYTRTWNLNGKDFTWKSGEHCLVLTGYDIGGNKVYVADPLKGNVSYSLDIFKDRYEKMYSQAVLVD